MTTRLTLEALEVIDTIARKGSFAAAAETLFRVPSALTYTVKKLEDDLGVALFDRSGHRATLTPAGSELLKEGRHLIEAAKQLECRVKRVATGVETDLTIAVSDLFSMKTILEIIDAFYAEKLGTRIKVIREVYGGSWDALVTGRADISIGAPGDGPPSGGCSSHLLGHLHFVFAVSPEHPLAQKAEPLHHHDIMPFRSIAAADSSRNLPARTSGILSGQDVLTVPDMSTKALAQLMGLGVGYLPLPLALHYEQKGLLVIKEVAETKSLAPTFLAWRTQDEKQMGKAQRWLMKRLMQLNVDDMLLITSL